MSETIKGRFDEFTFRSGNKNGKDWKLYTIVVDGKKYGFGFNPPKAAVGDIVTFTAETNDRGYIDADPKSFKVTGEKAALPAGSGNVGNPAPSYSDPRQASIEIQSSIASASRIVAAQINAGAELDPGKSVAALVRSFLNILHPAPKAAPKPVAPPVDEPDDELPPY